jgi:Domain of unknown function (DUF3846)
VLIKVAVLIPGKGEWEKREIENTLKAYQAIIGGCIEYVPICEGVSLFCHEEGKIINLPPSAIWIHSGSVHDILQGPLIVTGPIDDKGYETDITDEGLDSLSRIVRPVRLKQGDL